MMQVICTNRARQLVAREEIVVHRMHRKINHKNFLNFVFLETVQNKLIKSGISLLSKPEQVV